MVRVLRPLGSTFLVTALILLLAPAPPAAAVYTPVELLQWDWCVEGNCISDEGSLSISAYEDEENGDASYDVWFSGTFGSVSCWGERDSWSAPLEVGGSIRFPHDLAGEIVSTTIPCTDIYAYVGPLVIEGLVFPEMLCEHYGQVSGTSELIGRVSGSGDYLTYCG